MENNKELGKTGHLSSRLDYNLVSIVKDPVTVQLVQHARKGEKCERFI